MTCELNRLYFVDCNGNTTDVELEKRNFKACGLVACEIWNDTTIAGFDVECKYVDQGSEYEPPEMDEKWVSQHCLQTRYGLQIVKCLNSQCCKKFNTNWMQVFPNRFIPAPVIYQFGEHGKEAVEPSEYFKSVEESTYKFASLQDKLILNLLPKEADKFSKPPPFDLYCPSVQKNLEKCICETCGHYWPSQAAKKRHSIIHRNSEENENSKNVFESVEDEFMEENKEESLDISESGAMPVIENLSEFVASPWEFSKKKKPLRQKRKRPQKQTNKQNEAVSTDVTDEFM